MQKIEKMDFNDVLRRLRYALNISDKKMAEIFLLAEYKIEEEKIKDMLKKDEEEGFLNCNEEILNKFLDGLILFKRENKNETEEKSEEENENNKSDFKLTNNIILKKIKIALNLKSEDIIEILNLAGVKISKSELSAVLRREGHRNYKECGSRYLRNFLKGLTIKSKKND